MRIRGENASDLKTKNLFSVEAAREIALLQTRLGHSVHHMPGLHKRSFPCKMQIIMVPGIWDPRVCLCGEWEG